MTVRIASDTVPRRPGDLYGGSEVGDFHVAGPDIGQTASILGKGVGGSC